MKIFLFGIGGVVALVGIFALAGSSDNQQNGSNNASRSSSSATLQDAHGLAVDRNNSSKLYVATHDGLLVLSNDNDLQRVGTSRDDYMGFSAHPTEANTFYCSGHPKGGGNIGLQKSVDGGKTWQKVSNGLGGPVDFHTMTVNQTDPSILYGVYRGQMQRSSDEGKTWEIVSTTTIGNIITITTDNTSKDTVYAGTSNGLFISKNRGNEWSKVNGITGAVTAVAITPGNTQNMFVYADGQGLMRSSDGGIEWINLKGYSGSSVMQLASDVKKPTTIYLISQTLEINKTTNNGDSWTKVY